MCRRKQFSFLKGQAAIKWNEAMSPPGQPIGAGGGLHLFQPILLFCLGCESCSFPSIEDGEVHSVNTFVHDGWGPDNSPELLSFVKTFPFFQCAFI